MNDYENDNKNYTLSHYGVKGMRWGVRRNGGGSKNTSSEGKKKISEMSTKELNDVILRMETEQRYKKMMERVRKEEKGVAEKAFGVGKKIVGEAVTNAAKTAVQSWATAELKKHMVS